MNIHKTFKTGLKINSVIMNTNSIKCMKIISTKAIKTKVNQDLAINSKNIPIIISNHNKSKFCQIKGVSLLPKAGLNREKIHPIQIQVKCHLKEVEGEAEEEEEGEEENENEAEAVTRETFKTRNKKAREENTLKVEVIDEAEEAIAIEAQIMPFPAIRMIQSAKIKTNTRNLTSKSKIFR
jgi:hypothetical protein